MKNKELLRRRLENLNGKLKKLRSSLNLNNINEARASLVEIFDIQQDISDILEREN